MRVVCPSGAAGLLDSSGECALTDSGEEGVSPDEAEWAGGVPSQATDPSMSEWSFTFDARPS